MLHILTILTIAVLATIVAQDFKDRAIWWFLPFALLLLQLLYAFYTGTFNSTDLIVNYSAIAILLLTLWMYFSVRTRTLLNIFETHLGLGDVFMLFALAALLPPISYMLFIVVSSVFTLLSHAFTRFMGTTSFLSKTKEVYACGHNAENERVESTIPLAGYFSLLYIPLFLSIHFNLITDLR